MRRGLPGLVGAALGIAGGGPADIFVAGGHGRSYGKPSRVLGRGLPGILDCGLWDALACPPALAGRGSGGGSSLSNYDDDPLEPTSLVSPTPAPPSSEGGGTKRFALITDVGNDIMYGQTPEQVAAWVQTCIKRLTALKARIALGGIPIDCIRGLTPLKYRIIKALLFPMRDLVIRHAMERTERLHELMHALAQKHSIPIVDPPLGWYGFDPVHPRRKSMCEMWATYLRAWGDTAATTESGEGVAESGTASTNGAGIPIADRLRLRMARPLEMTWWHIPLGRPQPAARLADGSHVHVF